MSSRQIRRLEELACLAEAGRSASDSDEFPTTMQRKQPKKKAKRHMEVGDKFERDEKFARAPQVHLPEATKTKGGTEKSAKQDAGKKRGSKSSRDKGTSKVGDKPGKRGKKQDAALGDDDTFEAILQQFGAAHLTEPVSGSVAELQTPSVLVTTCDAAKLDPRGERIAAFGVTSVEPVKPKNPGLPKFRQSRFVTPDPNTWPPFDDLGVRAVRTTVSDGVVHYMVDDSGARPAAIAMRDAEHGDMNTLLATSARFPYYVPLLLRLHAAFGLMDNQAEAQKVIDAALYSVGVTLSTFPLSGSARERTLSYEGAAHGVYAVLSLGAHGALKKGCAKTAFEIVKLLISLVPNGIEHGSGGVGDGPSAPSAFPVDPVGAYQMIDYVALRGVAWVWMLERYSALEAANHPLLALPGTTFGAAMAAFFVQQSEKHVMPSECEPLPVLVLRAVRRFPAAAIALAQACGEPPGASPWGELAEARDRAARHEAAEVQSAQSHLSNLFAERHADLWKSPATMVLLRTAAKQAAVDDNATLATMAEWRARSVLVAAAVEYAEATADSVMGRGPRAIPQEALEDDGAGPMGGWGDQRRMNMPLDEQWETDDDEGGGPPRRVVVRPLAPHEMEALERLRAIFGPLEDELPLSVQLDHYSDMLADQQRALGEDHGTGPAGALALFLRTLLPWNDVQGMAIQRAMEQQGVDDPVAARRRAQREYATEMQPEFVTYDDDGNPVREEDN